MAVYAVVRNGIVDNLIVWDGESVIALPDGSETVAIPADVSVNIGALYNGTTFQTQTTQS